MVNYKSRANEEMGASLIGGALDMLNQYEANTQGDEYSANNPTEEYISQLNLSDSDGKSLDKLGGSLIGGAKGEYHGEEVGGSKIGGGLRGLKEHAIKHALELTPLAFHHLTEVAEVAKKHDLTHQSKLAELLRGHNLHKGALHDICNAKSKAHLARMIKKDVEIEGKVGGAFWSTLGKVAKIVPKVLPHLKN